MGDMRKINEAQDNVLKAEKALKTSILKWRPDYATASEHYDRAALCYKMGRDWHKSKECYLKAAECHKDNGSLYHAAKSYEQIVMVLKETQNWVEMTEFGHRAANLLQQQGSHESASSALERTAKMVEMEYPAGALELYHHAVETIVNEESKNRAAEYWSKCSRILIKLERYDDAADTIRREICVNTDLENTRQLGRLTVCLLLVQLARDDVVAAEKAYREFGGYCEAQEAQTLELLLQAIDSEDPDEARRHLNAPFIRHMDVEYAKLARDLKLPESTLEIPKARVVENVQEPYQSKTAEEILRVKEETIASGQWPAEPLPGTSTQPKTKGTKKGDGGEESDEEEEDDDEEDEGLC